MEGLPSYETRESLEKLFVQLIQAGKVDDARKLIQDMEREMGGRIKLSRDPLGEISMNLWRARLYARAGMVIEAIENYNAVRQQALGLRSERGDRIERIVCDESEYLHTSIHGPPVVIPDEHETKTP